MATGHRLRQKEIDGSRRVLDRTTVEIVPNHGEPRPGTYLRKSIPRKMMPENQLYVVRPGGERIALPDALPGV